MNFSKANITWLAVTLLIIAAGVGVWLWQRTQNDDEILNLKSQIASLEQSQKSDDSTSLEENETTLKSDNKSESDQSEGDKSPITIFDPAGLFNNTLKNQFTKSVIEPFTLYQKDLNQPVIAFHVQTSQVEGEYVLTAILDNGSYSGVLIGASGVIKWVPTCMDECTFSNEFKAKYPDIVSESNP